MSYGAAHGKEWFAGVPRSAVMPTFVGFLVLLASVGGFGAWAMTAPIAGARVAAGQFMASGQNKVVQHLEGGIIDEILVSEGDIVKQGQVLVRLDEVGPKSELSRLRLRHVRLEATKARLEAEIQERAEIAMPEHLLAQAATDPEVKSIVDSQIMTFQARRTSLLSKIATLEKGILALQEHIRGGHAQHVSALRQIELVSEELEGKKELLSKELIAKPLVLALERAHAGLEGETGRLMAEIGDANERTARSREQIASIRHDAIRSAVDDMEAVASELDDVRERIRHAQDVLERVEIIAPVSGIVVSLAYHTSGGVVGPGSKVMEILPLNEELVIQARIQPADIDQVRRGQAATVRLTALSQRITPMIDGEVIYVSADVLPDAKTANGLPADIYVVRVKLDPVKAAEIPGFEPTPGMPVEVYIKTEERTFMQYLLQPLKDSMQRAFRES